MKARHLFSALALSAGVCSVSMADVTGKATFEGTPPKPKEINMQAVADCAHSTQALKPSELNESNCGLLIAASTIDLAC